MAYLLDTNVVLHATREGSKVSEAIDAQFSLRASRFKPAICEVSIGELFIAGFGPGLLIGIVLMLFVVVYARWKGYGKKDHEGRLPFVVATRRAILALMMPVLVLVKAPPSPIDPTATPAV